jgi:hypothetical protein
MTQALVVNDIVKLQLWSHDSEQAAVNTFFYKVTAVGGSIGTLEDMTDAFSTAVHTLYKLILNQQTNFDGVLGQIVFPPPLMVAVKNNGDAGGGTDGPDAAARQAAGLIAWGTPLAGPGGRGRTYLPFTSAIDSEGIGVPNAAYIIAATNFAAAVLTFTTFSIGGRSATFEFGLKKRNSSTFTPVTQGVVASKWATQKRRGSYGRPNASPF